MQYYVTGWMFHNMFQKSIVAWPVIPFNAWVDNSTPLKIHPSSIEATQLSRES